MAPGSQLEPAVPGIRRGVPVIPEERVPGCGGRGNHSPRESWARVPHFQGPDASQDYWSARSRRARRTSSQPASQVLEPSWPQAPSARRAVRAIGSRCSGSSSRHSGFRSFAFGLLILRMARPASPCCSAVAIRSAHPEDARCLRQGFLLRLKRNRPRRRGATCETTGRAAIGTGRRHYRGSTRPRSQYAGSSPAQPVRRSPPRLS